MKFTLFSILLFCLYGYSSAASVAVNARLNTVCTVEIFTSTNCAVVEYKQAAATALFTKSQWVRTTLTQLNGNVSKFLYQVARINNSYQTGTQYLASPVIRESLTIIIQLIRSVQTAARTARVSSASTISAEVNAIITILESVRTELQQYTQFNLLLSFRLLSNVFSDSGCRSLTAGILRSAKVIEAGITAISERVQKDSTFKPLAFSLDFQLAIKAGNEAAMSVALASQSSYFEATSTVSTQATNTQLNAQSVVFSGYTTSIIVEFNTFAVYAQTEINSAVNLVIRLMVSSETVNTVYLPLASELLVQLADAYTELNAEFQVAIKDCKEEIDSSQEGGNGSNSSSKSSGSNESNNPQTPYSMKGEAKKCKKRGAGLIASIQAQYSKSSNAAVCGAFSVNAILTQVSVAQSQVNTCTTRSVVSFRKILEQVKALIKTEVDKNVEAMKTCACDAKAAKEAGDSSEEVSTTCTEEKVDVKFTKLRASGAALIAQLKKGGKLRVESQNCRLKVRSDFVARLTNVKASFRTCSGVAAF